MYEPQNEVNANVRRLIDLGSIYIEGIPISGKIPALFLVKPSTVGFASWHRTWGTRSCKNLMKACHTCRSIKSMSQVVKKETTQEEVMYNEHKLIGLTSKSSFLPEELEKRISRGYYRGIGLKSLLSMFILGLKPKSRIRSHPRRVNIFRGAHVSK